MEIRVQLLKTTGHILLITDTNFPESGDYNFLCSRNKN